jgi:two-component system chemotaxis response regulator CheB
MIQPKKVLIIDDSKVVRYILTDILSQDESIEVVGAASDPYEAIDKIRILNPDVITLDVEMPRMNGINFLKRLLRHKPLPVIMISSYTKQNSDLTIEALAMGAVDFITKPSEDPNAGLKTLSKEIVAKVKDATHYKVRVPPFYSSPSEHNSKFPENHFVVIGASTGGIQAIQHILQNVPPTISGLVIAQHIPGKYIPALTERLDNVATVRVKTAQHNDRIRRGLALIAPPESQLRIKKDARGSFVSVEEPDSADLYAPSIDILFSSAAVSAGNRAIGVLLTGMGQDGAHGLLTLKKYGAHTIAQDRESSVIFGMPRVAIELNAAGQTLSLEKIPKAIVSKLLSVNSEESDGENFSY